MNEINALPILFSLRNCPYAMRARIAVFKAKQQVILRDVILTDKPEEMTAVSPKGTVPILVLRQDLGQTAVFDEPVSETSVIDESLEIMLWAFEQSDPDNLLHQNEHNPDGLPSILALITKFDNEFKVCLEKYKCAKRYHEDSMINCRQACELYIQDLEKRLTRHHFLMSNQESLADLALLPFIRQFARVERQWYLQSPYPKLRQWLNSYLQSPMFSKIMTKYPLWAEHKENIIFGEK